MADNNQPPLPGREKIQTLHTYASDMADMVRTQEASVIKIALAEKKRRENEATRNAAVGTKKSNVLFILGSIVLIAIALFGIWYVIGLVRDRSITEPISTEIETFVSDEAQMFIPSDTFTSREEVGTAIKAEIERRGDSNAIRSLFLTRANVPITTEQFFGLIKSTAPNVFIRSLNTAYMLGIYTPLASQEPQHFFLLFKTNNYDQAFAGSLTWERTIIDDLFVVFGINVSGERSTLFEKNFEDILLNNKDARVLYDENRTPVLYSMFIDRNYYIITDNVDVINEVTTRIRTQNIKPI